MKKRVLKIFTLLLLIVAVMSSALITEVPCGDLDVATTTTYDYKWWSLNTIRNKLTTTYKSTSISYSAYQTVDTFENTKTYAVNHEFDDEYKKTSSVSLGTKVTIEAIELEAGYDVSYQETKSYNTTVSVPAGDTIVLQRRTKTETLKYSTVVQRQDYEKTEYGDRSWVNVGSSTTSSSTQTVKSPYWLLK